MNSCDNKPADSLVAGTFLGIDCDGNPVGAGGSIATCKDLQGVKDANSGAVKDAVDAAKADLADAIAQEKKERKDADADIKADLAQEVADRKQADKDLRNETKIKSVKRDGDMAIIELLDGSQYPFSVTDTTSGGDGDRPVNFAPSANGDNIEITLADGSVLDMTRDEFADWLADKDSSLTTDEELREAVRQGKQEVLDELNKALGDIDYDQATLTFEASEDGNSANLVLENEDKSKSSVSLLSKDRGNLLEARDNGLYYGIEVEPNLANLYVDKEHGDDNVPLEEGGGSRAKPFRTLQKALDITPNDKSNTIHLRCAYDSGEQQVHVVEKETSVLGGATRNIREYDQPYVSKELIECWRSISPRAYIFSLYAKENVKPIIKPSWREGSNANLLQGITVRDDSSISITGAEIRLEAMPDNGLGRTSRYGFLMADGGITLDSCRVVRTTEDAALASGNHGYNTHYYFNNVVFEFEQEAEESDLTIGLGGSTANITVSNGDYVVGKSVEEAAIEAGCGKPVTFEKGNAIETLTTGTSVTGIARHPTGVPLNVTSNFVI